MLITMGLAVLFGLAIYGVFCMFEGYLRRKRSADRFPPLKLVVVVKNQEEGVEYFVRRLMAEGRRRISRMDVIVVDSGSSDDTLPILRRMSNMFGFKLLELNEDVAQDKIRELSRSNAAVSGCPEFYYDARGMSGIELARAPLFQLLSTPRQR